MISSMNKSASETPHQRWARQRAAAHPGHRTSRDATMGGHDYCSSSQPGGRCGAYITR